MKPKVSILIITYNQADTIGAAIDSVLAQVVDFPMEIIIADDASTDATRSVCEDYARRYPEIVRLLPPQPNAGPARNYFRALTAAEGEYVADCAGDDTMGSRDRLRLQSAFLDSHRQFAAVISDWTIKEPTRSTSSRDRDGYAPYRAAIDGPSLLRCSLGSLNTFPFLSAVMFRREEVVSRLTSNHGDLLAVSWPCEDVPVIAAISSVGPMGYVPLNASVYTFGHDSVSNAASNLRSAVFYLGAAECIAELCDCYGLPYSDIAASLDRRTRYIGSLLIRSGKVPSEVTDRYKALTYRLRSVLSLRTRLYSSLLSNPILRRLRS